MAEMNKSTPISGDLEHHKSDFQQLGQNADGFNKDNAQPSCHLDQTIQVRDSDSSKNTMFYQVKCKYVLGLCVGILLVHSLVVGVLSYNRDTGQNLLERTSLDSDIDTDPEKVMDLCDAGHVNGFPRICDPLGCLRVLDKPSEMMSRNQLDSHNVSSEVGAGSGMIGWLAPVHVNLLGILTYIQWEHDVYGAVAGLGANQPIMTFALASQLDINAGEHLVLSDLFPKSNTHRFDQLYMYLDKFELIKHDHTEHFHVHIGSPSDLTKGLLKSWNLPQFRIVSVEGDRDADVIFTRLEKALCVLHEGGIVIIDGLDINEQETYTALSQFFTKHGSDVLTPLLSSRDKLYLCTSKWRRIYMDQITQQKSFLVSFHAKQVSNTLYGPSHSYYAVQR